MFMNKSLSTEKKRSEQSIYYYTKQAHCETKLKSFLHFRFTDKEPLQGRAMLSMS